MSPSSIGMSRPPRATHGSGCVSSRTAASAERSMSEGMDLSGCISRYGTLQGEPVANASRVSDGAAANANTDDSTVERRQIGVTFSSSWRVPSAPTGTSSGVPS